MAKGTDVEQTKADIAATKEASQAHRDAKIALEAVKNEIGLYEAAAAHTTGTINKASVATAEHVMKLAELRDTAKGLETQINATAGATTKATAADTAASAAGQTLLVTNADGSKSITNVGTATEETATSTVKMTGSLKDGSAAITNVGAAAAETAPKLAAVGTNFDELAAKIQQQDDLVQRLRASWKAAVVEVQNYEAAVKKATADSENSPNSTPPSDTAPGLN